MVSILSVLVLIRFLVCLTRQFLQIVKLILFFHCSGFIQYIYNVRLPHTLPFSKYVQHFHTPKTAVWRLYTVQEVLSSNFPKVTETCLFYSYCTRACLSKIHPVACILGLLVIYGSVILICALAGYIFQKMRTWR